MAIDFKDKYIEFNEWVKPIAKSNRTKAYDIDYEKAIAKGVIEKLCQSIEKFSVKHGSNTFTENYGRKIYVNIMTQGNLIDIELALYRGSKLLDKNATGRHNHESIRNLILKNLKDRKGNDDWINLSGLMVIELIEKYFPEAKT